MKNNGSNSSQSQIMPRMYVISKCLLSLALISSSIFSSAQTIKLRDQYLILNVTQIREGMNFGFVFHGPQLQYGRDWKWQKPGSRFELGTNLGISPFFRKGIGVDFHLAPVNFNFQVKISDHFWLGPSVLTDYNYEFYPDLQVGHDFWFSHYSAGGSFLFQKNFQKRKLAIRFSNSLLGFTSRTQDDFNDLYFDIGLKYALRDLHKDMKFSAINRYTVTHIEIDLSSLQPKRVELTFLIDYFGYYRTPKWARLNYGLKLTIKSKKLWKPADTPSN